MAQPQRCLNWRPSLGNHHVLKFAHIEKELSTAYPQIVDLGPKQSPVWDQGNSGSCSGYSSKSAIEYLELREIAAKAPVGVSNPFVWATGKFTPVSADFIYWGEREIEGTTDTDAGATTLLDACTVLHTKGAAREAAWPSIPGNLFKCPTSAAYADAAKHKLPRYYGVMQVLTEMQRCLANGFPFLAGIAVYDSFMTDAVAATGIVPYPQATEQMLGGHAILIVGYNIITRRFKFKGSWGPSWGQSGYGELEFPYVLNPNLAGDFYTLRLDTPKAA
jgi:C1A family cysteine protease